MTASSDPDNVYLDNIYLDNIYLDNIYLDNNATTPIAPEVLDAMAPCLKANFGNPSSIHAHGQKARRALDIAREQVAKLIGADPEEIIFTSGGTEANNLALLGTSSHHSHIISQKTEHPAILETLTHLESKGMRTTLLDVDNTGIISEDDLKNAIDEKTGLISIMTANNDTGTIFPIAKLAAIAKSKGVLFHTDGVQALAKTGIDVRANNVDMASFASHKIYGPKGVGALYVKRGTRLQGISFGGSQENRRRAGTENIAGIVGFGAACEIARNRLETDEKRIGTLKAKLELFLTKALDGTAIHGPKEQRLPGTTNVTIRGIEGETLLMAMDMSGISISVGSACHAESKLPSHVLSAMGVSDEDSRSSIRLSIGRYNSEAEIDKTITSLKEILERLRNR